VAADVVAEDLRRHRLRLTASGRRAAVGGMSAVSEEFEKRLAPLSAAQQKELKNLLEKII
jgi:MarR family transcriptional regulator, temperature-dependent positive regulator of motility